MNTVYKWAVIQPRPDVAEGYCEIVPDERTMCRDFAVFDTQQEARDYSATRPGTEVHRTRILEAFA